MSNDMKIIMEAWNSYLNEQIQLVSPTMEPDVSYRDVAQAAADTAEPVKNMSFKDQKLIAEMVGEGLFLTAQALDPSGALSYADLGRAWDKYTQEFNFNDPLSLDNLANAGTVVLNTIDIVPIATLFVTPVTVPLGSAKAASGFAELSGKAARLAEIASTPKVKKFALASQEKFKKLELEFRKKAQDIVVKLQPHTAYQTYGRLMLKKYKSKRNKLYGQNKFISKYKDKFSIPLGAILAGAISLAIGKTVYDIFYKDQKLPSKTTLEEMEEKINSIKKSVQDGTFKQELLSNIANSYNNKLVDLGEDSDIFSKWKRSEEILPTGINYQQYKENHVEDIKNQIENDPDIDFQKTLDSNVKEILSDIEKQYREKQMDFYKFEKDPETGAMVSTAGDKEAAIRAAIRTLESKISKAIEVLDTMQGY